MLTNVLQGYDRTGTVNTLKLKKLEMKCPTQHFVLHHFEN